MALYILTLIQASPGVFCVCSTSLLKTLWGKKGEIAKNMQVLFPTMSSACLENLLLFFFKFENVVCKLFQFERV